GFCVEDSSLELIVVDPLPFRDFLICDPDQNITIRPDSKGLLSPMIWSSNRDFTDTLNTLPDSSIVVLPQADTYYYFKGYGAGCDYVDSVLIRRFDSGLFSDSLICDTSVATVLTSLSGGIVTSVLWDTLSNFSSNPVLSTSQNFSVKPDSTTTYYLQVKTSTGCTYVDSVTLFVLRNELPNDIQFICTPGNSKIITAQSQGFAQQFIWSEDRDFANILKIDSAISVRPDTLTTYYLKIETEYCEFVDSIEVSPFEIPMLQPRYICPGDSVKIGPNNVNLYPNYQFGWQNSPYIRPQELSIADPKVSPDTTTVFYLDYSIAGCQTQLIQEVGVDYVGDVLLYPNPYVICNLSTPINLQAISNGASIQSYEWSKNPSYFPLLTMDVRESSIDYMLQDPAATIYLRCTTDSGCVFEKDITLVQANPAPPIIASNDFCTGDSVRLQVNNPVGIAPQSITWEPTEIMNRFPADGNEIWAKPTGPTNIRVTFYYNSICKKSSELYISPSTLYSYEPEINLLDKPVVMGKDFRLENNRPSSKYTHIWEPPGKEGQPQADVQTYTANDTLEFVVLKTTDFLCTKSDTFRLQGFYDSQICGPPDLFVPNAFSPNGDNENDLLKVRGAFIRDVLFRVYDRWGQLVFETTNQEIGWDGTFKGKALNPAVYVYYVEGFCVNNERFYMQGNVTLLR
ncbi:MAG: gliding motility-associated C-terminal domain-containing protein, partial [Luteibaculum sp.]